MFGKKYRAQYKRHNNVLQYCWSINVLKANYAINATPELALRSNRASLPARVIAALAVSGSLRGLAALPTMYYIAWNRS
jgi:hypothetical protein